MASPETTLIVNEIYAFPFKTINNGIFFRVCFTFLHTIINELISIGIFSAALFSLLLFFLLRRIQTILSTVASLFVRGDDVQHTVLAAKLKCRRDLLPTDRMYMDAVPENEL